MGELVVQKCPWITPTCCAAHVLSLELKDLAKIPAIADVLKRSSSILALFWGRKRWPRNRLREVIAQNHGRVFGLYRAKPTRFAGRYRELSRLLRVKVELQTVVISAEYARQKFDKHRPRHTQDREDGDDDDDDDDAILCQGIGAQVKAIVLDEQFWSQVIHFLRVAMPIIKLLRLTDSNKPVMGKIYDRMFLIQKRLAKWTEKDIVPWASEAQRIHRKRWDYLQSDMHYAGYVLDPQSSLKLAGIWMNLRTRAS